jgi:hypothetical protein
MKVIDYRVSRVMKKGPTSKDFTICLELVTNSMMKLLHRGLV